jgi:hypothetical protein
LCQGIFLGVSLSFMHSLTTRRYSVPIIL